MMMRPGPPQLMGGSDEPGLAPSSPPGICEKCVREAQARPLRTPLPPWRLLLGAGGMPLTGVGVGAMLPPAPPPRGCRDEHNMSGALLT